MQANKDNSIQIKENEKNHYHVEFTRHVKSGRKTKPVTGLQIFNARDFKQLTDTIDRQGIDILNWHEMRIVHDPVLQDKLDREKSDREAKAEAARIAKEKAVEAEAKKKAEAEAESEDEAEVKPAPKAKGRPPSQTKK